MKGLTDRERAFVLAFVGAARGVGAEAARMAGYSDSSGAAKVQAVRLLTKANVRKAIEAHQARVERARIAAADEVDETLTRILRTERLGVKYRIAAARELNKVAGRHSVTHIHKGKITLEEALGASREVGE